MKPAKQSSKMRDGLGFRVSVQGLRFGHKRLGLMGSALRGRV